VGRSHPGLVRVVNEDAHLIDDDLGLYGVADGVGGCAAGEVASQLALDTVRAVFRAPTLSGDADLRLLAAVEHANTCVRARARADRACAGTGTTQTVLSVRGNAAAIAHVGDTRAYRLRGRDLNRLTEDHTFVAGCVRAGILTPEQAAVSRKRNVITRAVGAAETIEVDTHLVAVEPGDTLLLCSDGLHGEVAHDEIVTIIFGAPDLTRAAAELVQRANDGGGLDNVTVVLVWIG
jgi:protein phosphatase